jgi:xanthine/CO dehydrogenase XdhC/CoxF family maturation factor
METDVKERVAAVLAEGLPSLVSFDMGSDLDLIWGTGMGCMGRADVLLERMDPDALPLWLDRCAALVDERRTGVLATVFQVHGEGPATPGDRYLREGDRDTLAAPPALAGAVAEAMDRALREGVAETLTLALADGEVDLLVEPILPPVALWVFGAGEHARPIFRLAKELGWYLGLADHRPALATSARFPEADRIVVGHPPEALRALPLDARCAALVVSHVFEADKAALGFLLHSPLGYLGLQGNRKRSERILRELAEEGGPLPDHGRAILHYPAGLDIGAESPEIIALSMVSEVQAALAGRPGSCLRDRIGPIH